ncbi:hypothetical protein TNCV_2183941 [Trichonephila clavipes]|nr:hypothetical protein TNCV_2183941 [Trichonephila clavipes]
MRGLAVSDCVRKESFQRLIQVELLDVRLSLAVTLSTIQVTVRFSSVSPQFRGRTPWGDQKPPNFLFLSPTSREDLHFDNYLENSHAAKALFIYKHPCLLRDSNSGPNAQQLRYPTTFGTVILQSA